MNNTTNHGFRKSYITYLRATSTATIIGVMYGVIHSNYIVNLGWWV
jgi:hypothetical protein